jgi:ATP-dependent DNA helicase RecG
VTSSGTLHFGITAKALFEPHESLPWNPLIARVLYRRGIIESWGRGTLRIAELAQRAGLPRPEIEEAGGCVTVRFRASRYVPPQRIGHDLTNRQRAVLAVLSAGGSGLALRELLPRTAPNAKEWELKGDLAILKALGLVRTSGHGRGARWILGGMLQT